MASSHQYSICPNCDTQQTMYFWHDIGSNRKCPKCETKYVIEGYVNMGYYCISWEGKLPRNLKRPNKIPQES